MSWRSPSEPACTLPKRQWRKIFNRRSLSPSNWTAQRAVPLEVTPLQRRRSLATTEKKPLAHHLPVNRRLVGSGQPSRAGIGGNFAESSQVPRMVCGKQFTFSAGSIRLGARLQPSQRRIHAPRGVLQPCDRRGIVPNFVRSQGYRMLSPQPLPKALSP